MKKKKTILVILGGHSKERDISLKTGQSCINALKKLNYKIIKFDPKFSSLTELKNKGADLIFNALHGKGGEDGVIQSFFEYIGLPYTHSGPLSSMLAMNKHFSKKLFVKNNIKTPRYFFLDKKDFSKEIIKKEIKKNKLKFPIVVKPNDEGSSIGVNICRDFNSLYVSFNKLIKKYENLIFENYIPGKEIQVANLGNRAIGAIELRPKRKFYDYKAKYKKSSKTEHIMPAEISKLKYGEVLRISQKAYKILKCRGIARCDFRFYKNKFFLLEVNTQPGMTSLSLVPEIAEYKNISFLQLVDWMVKDASLNR